MEKHITLGMKYGAAFAALCLSLGLGMATGCSRGGKQAKTLAQEDSVRLVDTTIAIRTRVEASEQFSAIIQSKVRNNISPQAPLRIERMLVEVGDRVAKGQVLARLDNSSLDRLKVQLDNAELDFKRTDELFKAGGLAQARWEQSKSSLEITRNQYRNMLDNTVLRSPVSGIVTARNYDSGDMSSPQLPIYVVEQIAPVRLKLNISEMYYGQVKAKMPVDVSLEAIPGESFRGYVSLVYPTIDAMSHTFGVEVEIPNAKMRIRPGMYARVDVHFGEKEVIAVNSLAINRQAGTGGRFVYVLKNNKVESREVKLGRSKGELVEIVEGLNAGDIVVSKGAGTLKEGQEVRISKRDK
ncbi:efflux RND transporter periplasmic adaptor subunit [Porphyromonas crevioricanis]|nr:efflux RND transporter periplasmic adaptor subunit [Porphyromonas crevioricanis]SKA03055.1 RND family efflux transporter, MFP subunit [Porphyromonas crevioricanis]